MPRTRDIRARAQEFADGIAELINQTVASNVTLVAYQSAPNSAYFGTAKGDDTAVALPIRIETGVGSAHLWLNVLYVLSLDVDDYLTVDVSVFGLLTGLQAEHELFRFDYERHKSRYPDSHFQVFGTNPPLTAYFEAIGKPKERLERLHFPMGGRRFRPSIEDLIEFLVCEDLIVVSEAERGRILRLVGDRRREFHRIQLAAAVRRDQDTAISTLNGLGYEVHQRKRRTNVFNLLPRQPEDGSRPKRGKSKRR